MGNSRLHLLALEGQIFARLFFLSHCVGLLFLVLEDLPLELGKLFLDCQSFEAFPLNKGRRLSVELLGVVLVLAKHIHVPSWIGSRVPKHWPFCRLPSGHGFSKAASIALPTGLSWFL